VPVEPENGIDEPVRGGVDLALRQRPQLDRLGAPRQRVRQVLEAKKTRGPGEEEPAGTPVSVDLALDGKQQLGYPLDLVDQQQWVWPIASITRGFAMSRGDTPCRHPAVTNPSLRG